MNLTALTGIFDSLRGLAASLSEDQNRTLNALPGQLAMLIRAKGTPSETVAPALEILEGTGAFQEKLTSLVLTGQVRPIVGALTPSPEGQSSEAIMVPLLDVLNRGGRCVECGAVQSVAALAGMDPETGLPTSHHYKE